MSPPMVRPHGPHHIDRPVTPASATGTVARSAIRPIRRRTPLPYDGRVLPDSVRSYLAEPAVPDPPARVWRDWALVGTATVAAVLETTLRHDVAFEPLPWAWRIASLVVFLASMPYALLVRRTRPLRAMTVAFGASLTFGVVAKLSEGVSGGLWITGLALVTAYSLYRWGSGREGALGMIMLLIALVVGNLTDASSAGDVIGGTVVLSLPVLIGMATRYRRMALARAVAEARAHERVALARELHDTVAHHVSAIAVQAQAGRAVAANAPEKAVGVLAVIEEAASRALEEMRAMVHTLRAGTDAELSPGRGLADLPRLSEASTGSLRVVVHLDAHLAPVTPAVGAALYRLAQEGVTNAVRHARRATVVRVEVGNTDDGVLLTVTDDGESTAKAATHIEGFGLRGMTERVFLLGGTFSAGALDGGGWQVRAELPRTVAS